MPRIQMKDEGCMLRAYKRNIVDLMVSSGEANTFISALALLYAENPTDVPVGHEERAPVLGCLQPNRHEGSTTRDKYHKHQNCC